MPDIDDLTYFTVVRTVAPVPAGALTADVVFEAQVTRGLALQADVSPDVIEVLIRPVHARIVNGVLMKDGTPGVELLSAAEVAIEGGFSYTATFKNERLDGKPLPVRDALRDLTFEALDTAGTFDLKDAAPIVASTAVPTARGPRGFGVDMVTRVGNTLRAWVQGSQVGTVDISDLIFNGTFDSLTDATTVGKALGRASTQAAARSAISSVGKGDLVINVKDYGATGDGTTDDTTAITNAVAALTSGAALYFPPGTYRMTSRIYIDSKSNFVVQGNGATISQDTQTTEVLRVNTCTKFQIFGLTLKHTSISGGRQNNGPGIRLDDSTDYHIHDNFIGPVTGSGMISFGATRAKVSKNTINGPLGDAIHHSRGSTMVSVESNTVLNTSDDGIACVSYLVHGVFNTQISIVGNTLKNIGSNGIAIVGGQQITVGKNVINSTACAGISVIRSTAYSTYGVQDCIVEGNSISGANTYNPPSDLTHGPQGGQLNAGIEVASADATNPISGVVVRNNVIRGGGYRMIQAGSSSAAGTTNVVVDGNECYGPNGSDGINAYNIVNVTISNNRVDQSYSNGIYVDSTCSGVIEVRYNRSTECNTSAAASKRGFHIRTNNVTFVGNKVVDSAARLERAFLFDTSLTGCLITGNDPGGRTVIFPTAPASWISAGTLTSVGAEVTRRTVQTVTSSTTLGALGDYLVFIGSGGAPTLPTAVGNTGRYSFKNTDTTSKNIGTTSSQTIDGVAAPLVLPAGAAAELVSDGTNWRVF